MSNSDWRTRYSRYGMLLRGQARQESQSLAGFFMTGLGSGECLPKPVMETYHGYQCVCRCGGYRVQ